MTLTAEQSSNKARYKAAPTAEIIDIVRIAMGEGCIRPCHVYDAVDELICRVQALEGRPKRNCDVHGSYGEAIRAFEDSENAEEYEDMAEWLEKIAEFCESGDDSKRRCYAENALNEITGKQLVPVDAGRRLCSEVDDPEDLKRVSGELEKLYDLTLTEADGVFSLQFKSEKAQSLVKYLNVWYRALNIYKAELKQAKNTEEAAAVQKRYNCFKWTLPELATDNDATKLQMKILSDAISELRKQLDLDMSSSQDTEENSAS